MQLNLSLLFGFLSSQDLSSSILVLMFSFSFILLSCFTMLHLYCIPSSIVLLLCESSSLLRLIHTYIYTVYIWYLVYMFIHMVNCLRVFVLQLRLLRNVFR